MTRGERRGAERARIAEARRKEVAKFRGLDGVTCRATTPRFGTKANRERGGP